MNKAYTIFFRASLLGFLTVLIAGYFFMLVGNSQTEGGNKVITIAVYTFGYTTQLATAILFISLPVFSVMMLVEFLKTWPQREFEKNLVFCLMALFFNVLSPFLFYLHLKTTIRKAEPVGQPM